MTVADARGRRVDAATGVVAMVLFVVGFALPGTPPKADDSTSEIVSFLADKRGELLAGAFLIGLGAVFFGWFLGSLRSYLRAGEGGEGRVSAAAFGGGVASLALLLAGMAVISGLVFRSAASDPQLGRALFDSSNALVTISGFPFAVLIAGASCSGARSGALPPWAYWWGSVAAALQVVAGVALFAESGFFAIGGAFALIAFLVAALWTIAVSLLIVRRNGVPPVPRTEP